MNVDNKSGYHSKFKLKSRVKRWNPNSYSMFSHTNTSTKVGGHKTQIVQCIEYSLEFGRTSKFGKARQPRWSTTNQWKQDLFVARSSTLVKLWEQETFNDSRPRPPPPVSLPKYFVIASLQSWSQNFVDGIRLYLCDSK